MLRNLKRCRCGGHCQPRTEIRADGPLQRNGKPQKRNARTYHLCMDCGAHLHTARVYAVPGPVVAWRAAYNRQTGRFDVLVDGVVITSVESVLEGETPGLWAVAKIRNEGYSARECAAEWAESVEQEMQYQHELRLALFRNPVTAQALFDSVPDSADLEFERAA